MNEQEQQYIDGRFKGVESEILAVNVRMEGFEKKIDKNLKTQTGQGEKILNHIMDLKDKTAHQNGDIKMAKQTAENADTKASEAKVMATDAHNRISSITVKILLSLIGGFVSGGFVYSVISKLLP